MRRQFTARVWREGKKWVSRCEELGVASWGKTSAEALKMLKEAVALYVEPAPDCETHVFSVAIPKPRKSRRGR